MTAHNLGNLHPGPLGDNPLFGTSIITSIFYGYFVMVLRDMMPLWRVMVKVIFKRSVFWLVLLIFICHPSWYRLCFVLAAWPLGNRKSKQSASS